MPNFWTKLTTAQPMATDQFYFKQTAERIDRLAGNSDGKVSLDEVNRVLDNSDQYVGTIYGGANQISMGDVRRVRSRVEKNTPLRRFFHLDDRHVRRT